MPNKIFKIKDDFSSTPGPRYIKEGKWSGEKLRTEFILFAIQDAIASNYDLIVDLDGTAGYGTSFLEEVFGGLIRINDLNYEDIKRVLKIKSVEEPYLIEDIDEYLLDAKNKINEVSI